ncbi:MAG TPA: TonB-dependent receptor [Burkholderiales bacterium]|nr:TonB-dependent receptor [Burkholderiales bacterium]
MFARNLWRAALPLACSPLVFAQPADDPVVVTASRTEQRLRDAIPHTTVLTRQDIRESLAVDLPTLLRREAGIEISQSGGLGGNASLFARGGRSAQTLVLIDGVRVEDAGFGTTAIQHLMLDDIDRIEIARGNVSSLYGSGAIGGVVQVFTRRGTGAPAPYGEATVGSRDTTKLTAGYGGEFGDTRLNVSALRLDTRGFSAIDPRFAPLANPDDDGYRNESVSASLAQRLGANHEVGVRLLRTRAKIDYDDSFTGPTSVQTADQDLGMAQLYWDAQVLERWKSRITVGQGTDYRTDFLDGAFAFRSNTRSRQLIWNNDVSLAPAHGVALSLERLEQEMDNSTFGSKKRDANSVRLGYLGRFGAHSLQANVRNDKYSDFGNADTYFLGYGFDLTDAWRLTASTSTAFRAPTFQDLFGFGGNPQLRPERARTNELGVQWASGTNRVRTVAFHTDYQDAITFDNATFTVQNVRKAKVTGVETSYSGRVAGIDLRAALTLQDAVEQEPDDIERAAIRRAKAFGSIAAFRNFGRLRLGGELLASGPRPDVDIATFERTELASYTVVNLLARYELNKNLYLSARLENAFDEDYQIVHGFNTAPRGFFLSVGWQP